MSAPDRTVEKAADRLEELATTVEEKGGAAGKLAPPLHEDAEFVRKLAPSKVAARFRDGSARPPRTPRRKPRAARRDSNGLVVAGVAFALGILIAKIVVWRSYAE